MKQRQIADGLTIQHGDDGHWLIFECDGRHGMVNIENTVKSIMARSAIMWWIDDALETEVEGEP